MNGMGADLLLVAVLVVFLYCLHWCARRERMSQRSWVPAQPPVDLDALDRRRQGGAERPERRSQP